MADRYMDDASIALVLAANLPISLAAIEEIIAEEDTSEFFYKSHYQRPEWPGGASGVTILLGYDLGYASPAKIHRDLDGKVGAAMVQACVSVSGITGSRAHDAMLRVRGQIDMPWEVALEVFLANDMPEWIATVRKYLPNTELLSPDCLGVLVSLAYNRGPSFDAAGDRYREMRLIKSDMAVEHFADIPHQLEAMARLWPVGNGVHSRRYREAALFRNGLAAMAAPAAVQPAPVPSPVPAKRGVVTAPLNMRSEASAASAVVATLAKDSIVEVVGEAMNGPTKWLRVNALAGSGYVAAAFVDAGP